MSDVISLNGVRVHNLKNISVDIPKNALVVITGVSGSGKSSLAFDTLFAEGQRRYLEGVSPHAARMFALKNKPDVDFIEGLSPTLAITQQYHARNPRSTVGTMTDIYDYVRVLFAKKGVPRCSSCEASMEKKTFDQIDEEIARADYPVLLAVRIPISEIKSSKVQCHELANLGYQFLRVGSDVYDIETCARKGVDSNLGYFELFHHGVITDSDRRSILEALVDLGDGVIYEYAAESIEQISPQTKVRVHATRYYCSACTIKAPELTPHSFSFNTPHGACPMCGGLGQRMEVQEELVVPNLKLSINEGALRPLVKHFANQKTVHAQLEELAKYNSFSMDAPFSRLSAKAKKKIFGGDAKLGFDGVCALLEKKYSASTSDFLTKQLAAYMKKVVCSACHGVRLNAFSRGVYLSGFSISDVVMSPIEELDGFLGTLKNDSTFSSDTVVSLLQKEITRRIQSILDIGLGYLTLHRSVPTLSGGEVQRLRLIKQLGASLTDVVYVLDEPSIGLHSKDVGKLVNLLQELKSQGNSIVVVEHDAAIMKIADYIIDIGPAAGVNGGEVVCVGQYSDIIACKDSETGAYLAGEKKISRSIISQVAKHHITIVDASEHNLKNVTVKIPLSRLVSVTGVSGSGKSTLVTDILAKKLKQHFHRATSEPGAHKEIKGIEHLDNIVVIDQSPIGRTPKSNPATYSGVFNSIRDIFANTPEARIKGLAPGDFSFNKDGKCLQCQGDGVVKLDMHLTDNQYAECDVCHGTRYRSSVLEIHINGKNIADVLALSVSSALEFFKDKSSIAQKLSVLERVGLGYLQLGQSAPTLSGGESQRLKLASELSKRSTGSTMYILDEPTTGLHFSDVERLLDVISQLVEKGNSVLVIEHNIDIIRNSDWVIDLGPDGGVAGGDVVAVGRADDIKKQKKSYTARYL